MLGLRKSSVVVIAVLLTLACASDLTIVARDPARPLRRIATLEGFDGPETAKFHPSGEYLFVSCMTGNPTERDGNGCIARVHLPTRRIEYEWIGGTDAGELHGPKGLAIVGRALWVADIDTLRAYDVDSGQRLASIDLEPYGAVALNDVAADPDGTLYVTDPRWLFTDDGDSNHVGQDRLFEVRADGAVTTVLQTNELAEPNGIEWDPVREQFVIVALGGRQVWGWRPGEPFCRNIATGPGAYDGIEILQNGSLLVSCLDTGSLEVVSPYGSCRWIGDLELPGNFGAHRNRLAIPLIAAGKVELWSMQ